MNTFTEILLQINENCLDEFSRVIETMIDTNDENAYVLDHFPGQQSAEELDGNDIFFECIYEANFDASRYYSLLYRYKAFINDNFSNCSMIYTDYTDLHIDGIKKVFGFGTKELSGKTNEMLNFTTSAYSERVLDLSFADKVQTVIVCDKYKCVIVISGFSCLFYSFDNTKLQDMKELLKLHNLYIWKKDI